MTVKPSPFHSEAVTSTVQEVSARIANAGLRRMFGQCLTNTLDTTAVFQDAQEPDAYVITGDIPAMWLRDSSAQVWPYLRFVAQDARLARMVKGLLARQARCILLDAYANAFLFDENETSEWKSDLTDMKPGVHERKYEVDSLCYPIRLAHGYWKATGDASIFTDTWRRAMARVLELWRTEQNHEANSDYRFQRLNAPETDTLSNEGHGTVVAITGMTWSGFRPSDDRCQMHYLVPSEAFAVVSLGQLGEMARACGDTQLAVSAQVLATQIEQAIRANAVVEVPEVGEVLAYEVDGLGGMVLMDDANVPSLLSLPYIGYCTQSDPLYRATRSFVLSERNPFFFRVKDGEGIGSPHTPRGRVWPIAVTMQALTSDSDEEILRCLRTLCSFHAGTYFMHESVDPDDPARYSRSWFAWANTLFGELILGLAEKRPELLKVPELTRP